MSKKRQKRKSRILAIVPVCFIVCVVILIVMFSRAQKSDLGESEENSDLVAETLNMEVANIINEENAIKETAIENSESLILSSVYTSSILNPDCGDAYAEEVASIEIRNDSDRYLLSTELKAKMSDGSEIVFKAYDLPAGAVAEAFDQENRSLSSDITCLSVVCVSEEYLDGDPLIADQVSVSRDDSQVLITNISDHPLDNITVVYHCDMGGQFFGGIAYSYVIESLDVGESYEVTDDNLMGELVPVRIYQ